MIYIIYSAEPEMARRSAMKILKKEYPERNECNYVSFNMAVSTPADIYDECTMMSLVAEKKAIFCEDCAFLAKAPRGKKGPKVDGLDDLASYCQNPSDLNDLYMVVYSESINEKNPVVDAVSKSGGQIKGVPIPSDNEWISYAKRFVKAKSGSDLDDRAARELVSRVDGNYGRFLNELDKLASFGNGEPIDLASIETLISPKIENDTFAMSNALTRGNIKQALKIYKDLKVFSISEIALVNQLASQFRFMDQVRFLDARGMDTYAIASELKAKPKRVEITLQNIYNVRPESIPNILEQLYVAEKSILTGEGDPVFVFQRFLANFIL